MFSLKIKNCKKREQSSGLDAVHQTADQVGTEAEIVAFGHMSLLILDLLPESNPSNKWAKGGTSSLPQN